MGLKLHLLFSTTVSSTQQEKAYEKVDSVTVTINRNRSTGKLHNRIQNYMHNLIKEIKDRIWNFCKEPEIKWKEMRTILIISKINVSKFALNRAGTAEGRINKQSN